jgi:predicted Zn-dependent protease
VLAELLLGREHAPEALQQLDKIKAAAALDDSSLRYLRARALEAAGRAKDADPLVADPKAVLSSYAPWWAIRGRFARARGDDAIADGSFFEAVALDPLDVEPACEGITAESRPKDARGQPLCDAARARATPDLGRD